MNNKKNKVNESPANTTTQEQREEQKIEYHSSKALLKPLFMLGPVLIGLLLLKFLIEI